MDFLGNAASSPCFIPSRVLIQKALRQGAFKFCNSSQLVGRTTEEGEERQERESHRCQQQGHLDDAGHASVFNARAEQVLADVIANLVVNGVVGRLCVGAKKIHN